MATVTATGGSAITSYNLEYNGGSGTVFSEIIGETSDSLLTTTAKSSLTAGTTYTFRYRVKNIHGWSGYSPTVDILCAKVPDTPAAATTSVSGTNVVIDWTAVAGINGDAIDLYLIEILDTTGTTYSTDTTNCDGADSTIMTNTQCSIPLTTL